MPNELDNTQTTPDPSSSQPGPNAAELQAKIVELEKQSEGRLRDLQAERTKRQELETRLHTPASSTVPENDVTQDEVGKVINPYIEAKVKPLIAKMQEAEKFVNQTYADKTMEYLAAKTGKAKDTVMQDKDLTDKLVDVAKRYGLQGGVYDVTKRAYEIMELEGLRASEAERQRAANATHNSSLPSGTHVPASKTGRNMSEADFNAMPLHEYEKLADSGSFVMDEQTRVVTFTPRS